MQKPAQTFCGAGAWAIRIGKQRGDGHQVLRLAALIVLRRHARVPHFILRVHIAEPQIA
jgi:hypothetical protein